MKAVAHLDEDFARVEVVSAAEGEAVVKKHAAIGDIDGLDVNGEALAEILAKREIECGVRLEMVAGIGRSWIAVGETGSVVDIGGGVGLPRKTVLTADVQSVALVVVEEAQARRRRGARSDEAASDAAEAESQLVGVSEIELGTVAETRRAKREFPSVNARALNGKRKKEIGVVEIVVIEEVFRASEEIIGVKSPAAERDGEAELVLFVALAV